MLNRSVSRRRFIASGAATSVALSMSSVARAQTEEPIVRYGARGGILEDLFNEAVIRPFEKTTGISVKQVPYPELAALKAMVDTNSVQIDLWEPDGKEVTILGRRGLLEPIDYSLLPPTLKDDLIPGSIHKYGVAETVYGGGIIYSVEKYSRENHPRTWAEFWDTKRFPGPRTLPDASYQINAWEAALLADGVPADKLYPIDFERAIESFERIRPNVVKFWSKAAEGMALLINGDAELGMANFGRATAHKIATPDTKIDLEFNQGITKMAYWAIPKGARYIQNAHKLISFYLEPKIHADWINAYPAIGPVNKKSFQFIEAKNKDLVVNSAKNAPGLIWVNDDWWAEEDENGKSNFEKGLERWSAFLASR